MKESERIEIKIRELIYEKEEIIKKIQPVPKGYYENELIGFRTQFERGSFIDAIRNTDFTPSNAKYRKVLKYKGEKISKEKLNRLRSNVINTNEPFIKRIEEIDEIIPVLRRKLTETKANELLGSSTKNTENKTSDNYLINLSEHGKLKKFVESFIQTEDFIKLNIPKHETLLANHKKKIENLLKQKYSDYKLNISSFYTILREHDYSRPRE